MQKLMWPAADILFGDGIVSKVIFDDIIKPMSRMVELVFGKSRSCGWDKPERTHYEHLAIQLGLAMQRHLGPTSCSISVESNTHIAQDSLIYGHPHNSWCFVFERIVHNYKSIPNNSKHFEVSFAKHTAIKEALLMWELRQSGPQIMSAQVTLEDLENVMNYIVHLIQSILMHLYNLQGASIMTEQHVKEIRFNEFDPRCKRLNDLGCPIGLPKNYQIPSEQRMLLYDDLLGQAQNTGLRDINDTLLRWDVIDEPKSINSGAREYTRYFRNGYIWRNKDVALLNWTRGGTGMTRSVHCVGIVQRLWLLRVHDTLVPVLGVQIHDLLQNNISNTGRTIVKLHPRGISRTEFVPWSCVVRRVGLWKNDNEDEEYIMVDYDRPFPPITSPRKQFLSLGEVVWFRTKNRTEDWIAGMIPGGMRSLRYTRTDHICFDSINPQ